MNIQSVGVVKSWGSLCMQTPGVAAAGPAAKAACPPPVVQCKHARKQSPVAVSWDGGNRQSKSGRKEHAPPHPPANTSPRRASQNAHRTQSAASSSPAPVRSMQPQCRPAAAAPHRRRPPAGRGSVCTTTCRLNTSQPRGPVNRQHKKQTAQANQQTTAHAARRPGVRLVRSCPRRE